MEHEAYHEEAWIGWFVLRYHQHLFTSLEHHVLGAFQLRRKIQAVPELIRREEWLRRRSGIPDDPQTDALMETGEEEFSRRVLERVLREHRARIELNRCPRCQRIPRTPRARQCLWCGHDWH